MKSKRTSAAFLLATIGGLLLFANCTVKTVDGGDTCQKGDTATCKCGTNNGNQTCSANGTWSACVCESVNTNGGSSNNGGDTNTSGTGNKAGSGSGGTDSGGTNTGGYAGATPAGGEAPVGGAGGEGGAGPVIDPADCDACLQTLCTKQWDACFADPLCISDNIDGSGQYERISLCIEKARQDGVVKRDAVRGCGVTIGTSADPNVIDAWAPEGMQATTTDLMNCLGGGHTEAPTADWANNDANFPVVNDMVQPTPWEDGTCAKLACTSKK